MDPRMNMVMVGARNIQALRSFYEEGLGWLPWMPASPRSVMYKVGTSVLVFLDAAYLAKESGIEATETPKSMWAVFVSSKQEVDSIFDRVVAATARITSAVRDRDGGLYSGYFVDPEGNCWEVVWSPHMRSDADGGLTLSFQTG